MTTPNLAQRITDYLAGGGLFNPELANHDAVRDLLIECRDALAQSSAAEQDTRRLDWLAFNFKTSTVYMSGQHPYRPNYKVMQLSGPTFRAAIDAAINASAA